MAHIALTTCARPRTLLHSRGKRHELVEGTKGECRACSMLIPLIAPLPASRCKSRFPSQGQRLPRWVACKGRSHAQSSSTEAEEWFELASFSYLVNFLLLKEGNRCSHHQLSDSGSSPVPIHSHVHSRSSPKPVSWTRGFSLAHSSKGARGPRDCFWE